MNTRKNYTPFIVKGKKYVFCNEDLEPAFEQKQLDIITEKWNSGYSFEQIAFEHNRDPDEIFLAIFHQARRGLIHRKITRNVSNVRLLKYNHEIPIVIEYENRRYVYDPQRDLT